MHIVSRIQKTSDIYFTGFLLFTLLLLPVQNISAENVYLVLNGKSIHTQKKQGINFNEKNFGAGFQYEMDGISRHWKPFINAGGFNDSFNKPSYYVGGGVFHRFKPLQNFNLDAGVTAFMMTREDVNDNNPYPAVLPMMSVGTNTAALNITYIPDIDGVSDELWFFQLKIKIID